MKIFIRRNKTTRIKARARERERTREHHHHRKSFKLSKKLCNDICISFPSILPSSRVNVPQSISPISLSPLLSCLFLRFLSLSLSVFSATQTKKLQKKSSPLRHKKNIIIMFASSQSLVQHHQRFSSPALIASTSRARNNTSLKKRANAVAVVVGAFF